MKPSCPCASSLAALWLLLVLGGCLAHDPLIVSPQERRAEADRLRSLGLEVNDDGPVLPQPFAEPWTRRSWLVPASWSRKVNADETVDATALGRDVELLRKIMLRAYSGWPTASARGWSWDAFFRDWQALLAGHHGGRMTLGEAFAPIKTLQAFQPDNHFAVPEARGVSVPLISRSALLTTIPPAPCSEMTMADGKKVTLDPNDAAQAFHLAKRLESGRLVDVAYLAYPDAEGVVSTVRCGDANIAAHPFWEPPRGTADKPAPDRRVWRDALANLDTSEPAAVRLTPAVDYVRLATFLPKNLQLVAQRSPTWPHPSSETRALIVDLRDNLGGNAPFDSLDGWIGAGRLKLDLAHRTSASCLWDALQWNESAFWSVEVHEPLVPQLRKTFQEELDSVYLPSPLDCPRDDRDQSGGPGLLVHRLMPPGASQPLRIFVLVNNLCASDCEGMLLALSTLPETVIVGMNTLGVGQFIQTGQGILPNTRLPFSFAMGVADLYGDKRSFDGYGLDVDVVLPDEADWSRENLMSLIAVFGDHRGW